MAVVVFLICGAVWWWFAPAARFYSQSVKQWQAFDSDVLSLAFLKDRQLLVALSKKGEVRVWNVSTGQPMDVSALGWRDIKLICAVNDADVIGTAGTDGIIRVVNISDQKEIMNMSDLKGQSIEALLCSPNFGLVAAYSDGKLHVWDVAKREKKCDIVSRYTGAACFAFTSDSKSVLKGTILESFVDSLDIERREKVFRYQGDNSVGPRRFGAIVCDREGGCFLTASWSGDVAEWKIGESSHVRSIRAHEVGIGFDCLAVSKDGSLMITAQRSGNYLRPSNIRIWNRESWELLKEIETPRPWSIKRVQTELNVNAIAVDSESEVLAVGHVGGMISVWSLNGVRSAK